MGDFTMKKAAFIIVAVLLFCMVCACSPADESFSELYMDIGDGDPDFCGKEFYMSADISPKSNTFLSYFRESIFGDEAIKRFDEVQKQFNCTIKQSPTVGTVENVFIDAAIGNLEIDIYVEKIFHGGNEFKTSGVLLPMSAVSDIIDISDAYKWGSPYAQEEFVYMDDSYGVLPMAWPENFVSFDFALIFNSDITAQLSLPDPRDYYENSQWTMSQFEKVLKDYTFTDNAGKQVKALGYHNRHFVDIALKSFGVNVCEQLPDGSWRSGYVSQRGYECMDWCRKVLTTPEFEDCIIDEGAAESVTKWVAKDISIGLLHCRYAFCTATSGDASCEISYCGMPFAVLPFPSEDGHSIVGQYERLNNSIMFPSWGTEPECSAMLVNAIFEPIANLNSLDDMINYYMNNLFFDRRDAEIVFEIEKQGRYLFHDEGVSSFNDKLAMGLRNNTGAELMNKQADSIQRLIEREVVPVREGMINVFGVY